MNDRKAAAPRKRCKYVYECSFIARVLLCGVYCGSKPLCSVIVAVILHIELFIIVILVFPFAVCAELLEAVCIPELFLDEVALAAIEP